MTFGSGSCGTKKRNLTTDYPLRIVQGVKGSEVRQLRKQLRLTQAQLAERVGVTASSVARWEQGVLGIRESAARLIRLLASQPGNKKNQRKRR